jgi:hypothetical protein
MKLNKIQKPIYDWLLSKNSYLKCSPKVIAKYYPKKTSSKNIQIALEQARITTKQANLKPVISLQQQLNIREGINVEELSNNLYKTKKAETSKVTIVNQLQTSKPLRGQHYLQPGLYISLGCVHAPFHLTPAFKAVQQLLHDNKSQIVGLVLAGDFLDMNSLSSHDRGRKPLPGVTLDWEYTESEILLNNLLDPLSNNIEKIYIFGNHEDRYLRYMSDSDNSKLGKSLEGPISGLKLVDKGFDIYENWKEDYITLGHHLDVTHGEFYNVHSAKKHIDTYRRSTLYYHTHRVQQYIEGFVGGYNGGSMADFNAPVFGYASRAMKKSWLNGFNTIHVDDQGFYHIQQIVCYNNSFVFGNKIYKY